MIRLDSVSKRHGRQILFLEASAAVERGEKVGLVGPNGAGKTTIFRLVTREEETDGGQVAVDRGVTVGYFSQDVGEMRGKSIVAETMDGAGPISAIATELTELEHALADPSRADEMDALVSRFGDLQARFEELGGYALDARAREILAGLGFAPETMDDDVGTLSGGWKMRVALAKILLLRPDALLLDEPTNHLDIESILWLEEYLKAFEGAVLMTSHDREFLNRLVSKIIEIDGGELVTYSGNFDFYEKQRAVLEAQAEAQYERQQAMLAKEQRFIDRFRAQAAKASQVQSRVKKLEKIEKVEPPKRRKTVSFEFRSAARSGDDVAVLEGIRKGWGKRPIYDNFDFLIRRRERWCVMGVNGAGKSTLLKLIAGVTEPDAARARRRPRHPRQPAQVSRLVRGTAVARGAGRHRRRMGPGFSGPCLGRHGSPGLARPMPLIHLETAVRTPIDRGFDLARRLAPRRDPPKVRGAGGVAEIPPAVVPERR